MSLWGLLLGVFAFAHQLGHSTSVSPCSRTCAAWQVTEARPPTKSYQSALPRAPVVPYLIPLLLPDRSQQQYVNGLPHVCRSAFYVVTEDVAKQTGDIKPTKVFLSCPTRAKTWPKVWCTSHGRRAGHDGVRHALLAALHFGWLVHFASRALSAQLLDNPKIFRDPLLRMTRDIISWI